MKIAYQMDRWLYGIEEWEQCSCEYCKNKMQRKKDRSQVGLLVYMIRGLWESRLMWFLIGVFIASLFE